MTLKTFGFGLVAAVGFAAGFAVTEVKSFGGTTMTTTTRAADAGAPSAVVVNASDVPIDGLDDDELKIFRRGDALFELVFREPDGLGPLSVRSSCGACHAGGLRGPGLVQKMVVVDGDGALAADQSAIRWGNTLRPRLNAKAKTPVMPPSHERVKVTTRLGPPVLGRGYMEAIRDEEIERMEREQAQRSDGIHGHINRVTFTSVPNPDKTFGTHQTGDKGVIGRFGLKARIASLDEFTADAFQGDMGITTPMRPNELANPDGLTDDGRPGVDLGIDDVNLVAGYVRRIAIPVRLDHERTAAEALFSRAKCDVCHAPSLATRADYPIKALAGIDAPVYTDMLVHDMGPELADGLDEWSADGRSWRTAPLIGLRFLKTFLHDGRASSVEAAIEAHAGEAKVSRDLFGRMSADEKKTLVAFVEAL